MSCSPISTGQSFLYSALNHIDCQAQSIGSYGYGALADTRSSVFAALTALLTIFVALYGMRLILNAADPGRGLVADVIRVGVVLTLATSWPAWRTVGYDVVMNGPFEVAQSIGMASGLDDTVQTMPSRLQALDDDIVALTAAGTGRLSGGAATDNDGQSFEGIALADQFALGLGRTAFLSSALIPYGAYRLGAGVLLALAPLMAGLLLFVGTSGLFWGWVRGLVFCALGSLTNLLVQSVQITLLEPWLSGAINRRIGGDYTPSAPTELLVLGIVFAGITTGLSLLLIRVCFYTQAPEAFARTVMSRQTSREPARPDGYRQVPDTSPSRAQAIAEMVRTSRQREYEGPSRAGSLVTPRADMGYLQSSEGTSAGYRPEQGRPVRALNVGVTRSSERRDRK